MIGIDLVEIKRIQKAVESDHGDKFLEKIFTETEISYCKNGDTYKYESLAARFAAKEAVLKALGKGLHEISWLAIEVKNEESGQPKILLHDEALAEAINQDILQVHVSLTHTTDFAVATCILEHNKR